ncbi:MAG: DNA repair protein RadC [Cyclobacteriaceae bacterium]|nr:DNA repair protein RadC [Cyclobacteriaceae bacterium]
MDNYIKIQSWAEEDRPREKLLLKGKSALTDAELLAILIGSGTRKLSAVDLAKMILSEAGNDLNQLARFSVRDLTKMRGIGDAKAISIVSALELGRRRKDQSGSGKTFIKSSRDAYQFIKPDLMDLSVEQFWTLYLNRANMVIKKELISIGGIGGTVVDARIIFKKAIENQASGIILVHNHPSGQLKPSKQDLDITRKIKQGGDLLDTQVLDHIIFTNDEYLSFADEGLL